MAKIIAVHSFRGGTGKSNTTSNLAALLAMQNKRVGVVDTDIQSPGIHVLFGLKDVELSPTLNDYLWGQCTIQQAAHDIGKSLRAADGSQPIDAKRLYLIPSSMKPAEIARVLRERYDVDILNDGFHALIDALNLDVLLIDTHPGLNDETLLSIAIADALVILLRPDHQDFQGTGVTVEVARRLKVPRMTLIVNKVPASFAPDEVKANVEQTYGCNVAAVLPHADEVMTLASAGVFVLNYPDHVITQRLKQVANLLVKD